MTTTIEATLQAVSDFTASLEAQFSKLTIEDRTAVVLAIQELGVNIVRHAYDGVEGKIEIQID